MARPRIRTAKFGDIPALYEIIVETHERSRYADGGQVNEKRCKALLMQSIQRHGGTAEGATFVAVADNGKGIEGFIIAILQPIYLVGSVIEATDLFWLARPGANAATAWRLLKAMHKWVPEGALIRQGNTDIVSDIELSGRMLERSGMRLIGHVYEKMKETPQCQES